MRTNKLMLAVTALSTALFSLPVWADCSGLKPGTLDSNGDFAISRDEAQGTKLASVFDQADANQDGVIVHSEWSNACSLMAAIDNAATGPVGNYVKGQTLREVDRQQQHVNDRVQDEVDNAADSAVEKGLDSIFGH